MLSDCRLIRQTALVAVSAACVLCLPASSLADRFLLKSGGRIEGRLLNSTQSPRTTFLVETEVGAIIELKSDLVRHVIPKSEAEQWYDTWLPKMPDSLRGHTIMAEQCKLRDLDDQREYHLRQVLRFDADHEEARYGLGYNRVDGEWHQTDLWNREHGYIRYEGRWLLPQIVAIEKAKALELQREVDLKGQLKIWRSWLLKGRGKEQEALQNMRAVRDPLAAGTLAEFLEDEDEPPSLKLLYIEMLGNLNSPVATDALVERAMQENLANLRDRALDELAKRVPAPRAVAQLVGYLDDKNNLKVNRAAVALARMKDTSVVTELIDALITEHKFQITTGGGPGAISPTFSSGPGGGGLGGLSMGGKPKIVKQEIANNAVRDALVSLTGANYNFDKDAWRRWLAQQNVPQEVNLRRPGE